MKYLDSAAHAAQNLFGKVSGQHVQLEWILLAVLVVAILLMIFALDKPKTILWLLVLYTVLFILIQLHGTQDWINKNAPDYARYMTWIVGAIPVVVIGVIKFKRKK